MAIVMSESEVERAVIDYFQKKKFTCFPDRDLKWSRFTIFDYKDWEPDVVAFKWNGDGLTLDIRAVECKDEGTFSNIVSAQEQAQVYKKHFPSCYISAHKPNDSMGELLRSIRDYYQIGFLPVTTESSPTVDEEGILDLVDGHDAIEHLNYDLVTESAILTRQKIAAFATFAEHYKDYKIIWGMSANHFWISRDEMVQYHLNNKSSDFSFRFGIDIEKKPNVQKSLGGDHKLVDLQEIIDNKKWAEYTIYLVLRNYSNRRPKVQANIPILHKRASDLTREEAKKLDEIIERNDYQVLFKLTKPVWQSDEMLFRDEHLKRLEAAEAELSELRDKMEWKYQKQV